MSDNPADATPQPAPDAPPLTDAPATPPAPETPPGEPIAPPPAESADPPAEPDKPKEASWVKPAINRLTREKHEAQRELEAIKREVAIYKAMVENRAPEPAPDGTPAPMPPRPAAASTEADVDARAEQIVAQRQFADRQNAMVAAGNKDFGEKEFFEKAEIIANLGATNNPAFMQAIVAVPQGHKIAAALADEPSRLMSLLSMGPVEMATEIGRMSAEISAPPPPKPVSRAPAPVAPIQGRAQVEPSVYDPKLSMAEYVKMRQKQAPKSLGGMGKR